MGYYENWAKGQEANRQEAYASLGIPAPSTSSTSSSSSSSKSSSSSSSQTVTKTPEQLRAEAIEKNKDYGYIISGGQAISTAGATKIDVTKQEVTYASGERVRSTPVGTLSSKESIVVRNPETGETSIEPIYRNKKGEIVDIGEVYSGTVAKGKETSFKFNPQTGGYDVYTKPYDLQTRYESGQIPDPYMQMGYFERKRASVNGTVPLIQTPYQNPQFITNPFIYKVGYEDVIGKQSTYYPEIRGQLDLNLINTVGRPTISEINKEGIYSDKSISKFLSAQPLRAEEFKPKLTRTFIDVKDRGKYLITLDTIDEATKLMKGSSSYKKEILSPKMETISRIEENKDYTELKKSIEKGYEYDVGKKRGELLGQGVVMSYGFGGLSRGATSTFLGKTISTKYPTITPLKIAETGFAGYFLTDIGLQAYKGYQEYDTNKPIKSKEPFKDIATITIGLGIGETVFRPKTKIEVLAKDPTSYPNAKGFNEIMGRADYGINVKGTVKETKSTLFRDITGQKPEITESPFVYTGRGYTQDIIKNVYTGEKIVKIDEPFRLILRTPEGKLKSVTSGISDFDITYKPKTEGLILSKIDEMSTSKEVSTILEKTEITKPRITEAEPYKIKSRTKLETGEIISQDIKGRIGNLQSSEYYNKELLSKSTEELLRAKPKFVEPLTQIQYIEKKRTFKELEFTFIEKLSTSRKQKYPESILSLSKDIIKEGKAKRKVGVLERTKEKLSDFYKSDLGLTKKNIEGEQKIIDFSSVDFRKDKSELILGQTQNNLPLEKIFKGKKGEVSVLDLNKFEDKFRKAGKFSKIGEVAEDKFANKFKGIGDKLSPKKKPIYDSELMDINVYGRERPIKDIIKDIERRNKPIAGTIPITTIGITSRIGIRNITRTGTRSIQKPITEIKSKSTQKQEERLKQDLGYKLQPRLEQTSKIDLLPRQIIKPKIKTDQKVSQSLRQNTISSLYYPSIGQTTYPKTPEKPTPIIPPLLPFSFPKSTGSSKSILSKFRGRKYQYSASVEALVLNIKSKKKVTGKYGGAFSGQEIRPIIT